MNIWFYIMFVWLVAVLLGQAAEVGSGFTSSTLAWPLLEVDQVAAVEGGDWKPGGGSVFIGDEEIYYAGVTEPCPGLPRAAKCLHGLQRGQQGTKAANYAAGSSVNGSESEAIEALRRLQNIKVDTGWGVLTFPYHGGRALGKLVAEVVKWDYAYLDNQYGEWVKLFFRSMTSLALVILLLQLFAGPLSSITSGLGRTLTGGRL